MHKIKLKRIFGLSLVVLGTFLVIASKQITGAAIGVSGFSLSGLIGTGFFIVGLILTYESQPRMEVYDIVREYRNRKITAYEAVNRMNEAVGGIQEVHYKPEVKHSITTPRGIVPVPVKGRDALELALVEYDVARRNNPQNHSEIHGERISTKHHAARFRKRAA